MKRPGQVKYAETESDRWLPGAGGWGREGLLHGSGVQLWGDGNVLEPDRGGGRTTL